MSVIPNIGDLCRKSWVLGSQLVVLLIESKVIRWVYSPVFLNNVKHNDWNGFFQEKDHVSWKSGAEQRNVHDYLQ